MQCLTSYHMGFMVLEIFGGGLDEILCNAVGFECQLAEVMLNYETGL